MKKIVSFVLATMMVIMGMTTAFAQYNVAINGEVVEIPADMGEIKAHSNRTFVPVRFILENFGYKVEYMQEDKQIMGTDGKGSLFMMQIGSPYLFFKTPENAETTKITMDVEPFVDYEMGRVYVPARFLVEEIGYKVDYDSATQTVIINEK